MADCDCDYCYKENSCQFAYSETNCREMDIRESKDIVSEEFKDFFLYLKGLNADLCNDEAEQILYIMHDIISDSEIELNVECDDHQWEVHRERYDYGKEKSFGETLYAVSRGLKEISTCKICGERKERIILSETRKAFSNFWELVDADLEAEGINKYVNENYNS